MKLILIRHGDPDYTHDSLTTQGRAEAQALNRRVLGWPAFDAYVSPLGRAQETARIALAGRREQPRLLPWLEEFRGRLADGRICWDLAPTVFAADDRLIDPVRWPEAPTYAGGNVAEVYAQTAAGLDALLAGYGYRREGRLYRTGPQTQSGAAAVLFCHQAVSLACLSHLMSCAAPVLWQQVFLPPASVTILGTEEHEPGAAQWRAQCFGDASHLRAAGVAVSPSGYFTQIFPG